MNQAPEPTSPSVVDTRRRVGEENLWRSVGTIWAGRRLIVWMTGLAAVASVVISLTMPNWYRASARLLMPEGGAGLSSALLRNLPSAASALLGGGGGGDFMRYLTILTSRSVMSAAVDSFDLVTVYERQGSRAPFDDTIDDLRDHAEFEIDLEYQFLSVSVSDKDPERAADLANFFVRQLNETNSRLAAATAANYRAYVEKRYLESLAAMDTLLNQSQRFQQEYGIYDLPSQTESFFRQVGEMRAQAVAAEIQAEVARNRLGPENPQVANLNELARAANAKYDAALRGSERLMPVAQNDVPTVARTYASLEMERMIQVAILEILGPMYEQARLQEEKESEAVQVVDYAVTPVLKARPKRSIIVIMTTLSVFLLTIVYLLVRSWVQGHGPQLFTRLQSAAAAADRRYPANPRTRGLEAGSQASGDQNAGGRQAGDPKAGA